MIPDSEYNLMLLIWFGGWFGTLSIMILWSAWQSVKRDRRDRSYYRHPSQRNRGTVQK